MERAFDADAGVPSGQAHRMDPDEWAGADVLLVFSGGGEWT